jgi:TPP-dependent pyruvate/acetoin dehydrogenase alpha subunit
MIEAGGKPAEAVGAPPERVRLETCTGHSTPAARYALLVAIRLFEQSLLDLFSTGALTGTTHTCIGQETIAVGVMSAIDQDRDIVFSNHRGHGHFLAYCGEIERLYLEVLGKPGGVCGGRGGSQHLQFRNFYSNGVQGGIVPVTAGMALAEKLKRTGTLAVVFLGDGTLGEGAVYEAFNIAGLWQLPIVFVIEDNGYSQSTPSSRQLAGTIGARPEAFGIPTAECAATDVEAILTSARSAVEAVRARPGPRCLVCSTYRLAPHSKGDDHRPLDELEAAWSRDPLKAARAGLRDDALAARIERDAERLVGLARQRAISQAGFGEWGHR